MAQEVETKIIEKEPESKPKTNGNGNGNGFRYDLLSIKPVNWLFRRRWYPQAIIAVNFVVFMLVIAAGFFGTSVGNANISIILVWIVWWVVTVCGG